MRARLAEIPPSRPRPTRVAVSGPPGSRFPGWKGVFAGVSFSVPSYSSHVDAPSVASFPPGVRGVANLTAPTSASRARGEPHPVARRCAAVLDPRLFPVGWLPGRLRPSFSASLLFTVSPPHPARVKSPLERGVLALRGTEGAAPGPFALLTPNPIEPILSSPSPPRVVPGSARLLLGAPPQSPPQGGPVLERLPAPVL